MTAHKSGLHSIECGKAVVGDVWSNEEIFLPVEIVGVEAEYAHHEQTDILKTARLKFRNSLIGLTWVIYNQVTSSN